MSGLLLHGQKMMMQYVSLYTFSAEEQHRAENLADLLEEGGLSPALDYDDDGSAYVSVAEDEQAQAETITQHFIANYDGALSVLIASKERSPIHERLLAYAYGVGFPTIMIIGSIWALLGEGTTHYEQAAAVIALLVMVPWLIAFSLMLRRGAV